MCGICGTYRFDGAPVGQGALEAMAGRMVHRGPDDAGFYRSGAVGLGMRRLSIIDVEGGHQPIANEDETIWLVFNGEIYNYVELRRDLERRGHRFRTSSDTETILHLYEEKGTGAIDDLNGMFAFALYDTRKEALWIVRDRLGIKPLYFSRTGTDISFASDLAAVRQTRPDAVVSRAAFLKYLALSYVPGPDTIFMGIEKLAPGHWMWVSASGVESRKYWGVESFESWTGNEDEAREQLDGLLRDAVHLQLRSDVPVGLYLSGGLDSGTVVALASGETSDLHTLTVDFAGKGSADTGFARALASQFGTSHNEVSLESGDVAHCLDEMMLRIDEPVADSALVPSYVLARAARAQGIKVLLTGAGGDEIFGGYRRHFPPRMPGPGWIAENVPAMWRPGASALLRLVDRDWAIEASHPSVAFGAGISAVSLDTCASVLARESDYGVVMTCLRDTFGALAHRNGLDYSYSRMHLDLREYLVGDVLALLDKTTMACSVEGRVPLLDHRLVEFAFSLPRQVNLLNGEPKGLFKKTVRRALPETLLNRPKEGFNAPLAVWAMGTLGARIEQELVDAPIAFYREVLDLDRVRTIVRARERHPQVVWTLFNLYLFSHWYRAHVAAA